MSIIITNVTENLHETGPNTYILRINEKVIARFKHQREDGLAECLRRASEAAKSSPPS